MHRTLHVAPCSRDASTACIRFQDLKHLAMRTRLSIGSAMAFRPTPSVVLSSPSCPLVATVVGLTDFVESCHACVLTDVGLFGQSYSSQTIEVIFLTLLISNLPTNVTMC